MIVVSNNAIERCDDVELRLMAMKIKINFWQILKGSDKAEHIALYCYYPSFTFYIFSRAYHISNEIFMMSIARHYHINYNAILMNNLVFCVCNFQ